MNTPGFTAEASLYKTRNFIQLNCNTSPKVMQQLTPPAGSGTVPLPER